MAARPVTAESHTEFADMANTNHLDGAGISAPLAQAWALSDLATPSGVVLYDGLIYFAGGLDGGT